MRIFSVFFISLGKSLTFGLIGRHWGTYKGIDLGVYKAHNKTVILLEVNFMRKGKVNITLDHDLIDFIKHYAEAERTSISEIFTQFVLNLKRT